MSDPIIGEVTGVNEGDLFEDRKALHNANVHRGMQAGIAAKGTSIVLSGGYEDDIDDWDSIIYTGAGGRKTGSTKQEFDQELTRGNLYLNQNYQDGNPIRVCRGASSNSKYAPISGYRYDGLYRIEDCWSEKGLQGFKIWRFKLTKISPDQIIMPTTLQTPRGNTKPKRSTVTTTRVVRNSKVCNYVKKIYEYTCQITGVKLDTPSGPYAEGCHIKPVGTPHNGPDVIENVLCLSPNMHVLFDLHAISLSDDLELLGMKGKLTVKPGHNIDLDCIRFHRSQYLSKK